MKTSLLRILLLLVLFVPTCFIHAYDINAPKQKQPLTIGTMKARLEQQWQSQEAVFNTMEESVKNQLLNTLLQRVNALLARQPENTDMYELLMHLTLLIEASLPKLVERANIHLPGEIFATYARDEVTIDEGIWGMKIHSKNNPAKRRDFEISISAKGWGEIKTGDTLILKQNAHQYQRVFYIAETNHLEIGLEEYGELSFVDGVTRNTTNIFADIDETTIQNIRADIQSLLNGDTIVIKDITSYLQIDPKKVK